MRTHFIRLGVIGVFLSQIQVFAAEKAKICTYQLDPSTLVVQWTAFKTQQRVGVPGDFVDIKLQGPTAASSLIKLLKPLRASLQVSGPDKYKTGNPARDTTLFDHFFKHWEANGEIQGEIINAKTSGNDNEEGTFDLKLTANKKTQVLPFTFKRDQGILVARGSLNILRLGLSDAFAHLHKACETLHQGPDGISKTWPEVDIMISAKVGMRCP